MKKEKTKKEPKKEVNPEPVFDVSFLDMDGGITLVKEIIKPEETWLLEKKREKKSIRILSHSAVQKIARIAGIATNAKVEESQNIIPSAENSFNTVVSVTIKCNAATNPKSNTGCVHDWYENYLTMTGEASKLNTGRGKDYLRTMAEKRGYDRAVLRHLGIDGVYSEEEAIAFDEDAKSKVDVISEDDLKGLVEFVNGIFQAKNVIELKKVADQIKKTNCNENQLTYLRELYKKANSKYLKTF